MVRIPMSDVFGIGARSVAFGILKGSLVRIGGPSGRAFSMARQIGSSVCVPVLRRVASVRRSRFFTRDMADSAMRLTPFLNLMGELVLTTRSTLS